MSSHANKNIGRIARLLAIAAVLLFPLAASAAQDKTLRAPARPPAPAAAPAKPHLNVLREAEAWGVWGENRIKDFSGEVSGIRLDRFLIKPEPHQASGLPGDESAVASAEYYFGDALQSVHQVTNASGVEIRRQFTDAWGNQIAGVGFGSTGTAGDRYGFQGRESDTESGLQYFRARSYDPMTGRFTSRDPVPYPNLYVFADNDPVNRTDPSGMDSIKVENGLVFWISEDDPSRVVWMGHYSQGQGQGTVKLSGFKQTNMELGALRAKAKLARAAFGNSSDEAMRGIIQLALGGRDVAAERKLDNAIDAVNASSGNCAQSACGAIQVVTGAIAAPFNPAVGSYLIVSGSSRIAGAFDPTADFVGAAFEKDLGPTAGPIARNVTDFVAGVAAPTGPPAARPLNVVPRTGPLSAVEQAMLRELYAAEAAAHALRAEKLLDPSKTVLGMKLDIATMRRVLRAHNVPEEMWTEFHDVWWRGWKMTADGIPTSGKVTGHLDELNAAARAFAQSKGIGATPPPTPPPPDAK